MHSVYFNLGDWATATRLLTLTEKAIYFDLLCIYYEQERPIMQVQCKRIASAYAQDELDALNYILETFFELKDGEYRHARCDAEIASARMRSDKRKKAAEARWNKVSESAASAEDPRSDDASAMQMHSKCNANALQMQCKPKAISHKPYISPPSEESGAKKSAPAPRPKKFVPPEVGMTVTQQEFEDFLAVRKAKRAPLTPTAWARLKKEAELAGITLSEALGLCIAKGWTSIDHTWESLRQSKTLTPDEVGKLWAESAERDRGNYV